MNAFYECCETENQSREIAETILSHVAGRENWLRITGENAFARDAQRRFGDYFVNVPGHGTTCLEIKSEWKYTGRLFLETWSNWTKGGRRNPGWVRSSKARLLWYHVIGNARLIAVDFPSLQDWLNSPNVMGRYEELRQSKHSQLNISYGLCVPIRDILEAIPAVELDLNRCSPADWAGLIQLPQPGQPVESDEGETFVAPPDPWSQPTSTCADVVF